MLFLELACIRWFAAYVAFLQFFTNITFIAYFFGMSCGCPAARSDRDWLGRFPTLAVGTVAAALARFAFPGTGEASAFSGRGRLGPAVLGSVLALQVGYVAVDYFWAFARSGGRLSYFQLGKYLAETGNHFVRKDRLYPQLVDAGVRDVIGEPLLVWSLAGCEIPVHRLKAVNFSSGRLMAELASPRPTSRRVAVVLYNISAPAGGEGLNELRDPKRLDAGGFHYPRDPAFDDKLAVLVSNRAVEAKGQTNKP